MTATERDLDPAAAAQAVLEAVTVTFLTERDRGEGAPALVYEYDETARRHRLVRRVMVPLPAPELIVRPRTAKVDELRAGVDALHARFWGTRTDVDPPVLAYRVVTAP